MRTGRNVPSDVSVGNANLRRQQSNGATESATGGDRVLTREWLTSVLVDATLAGAYAQR